MAGGTATLQSQSSKGDEEREDEGEERGVWVKDAEMKITVEKMRLLCLFLASLFALGQ